MDNKLDLAPIAETMYAYRNRARFVLGEIDRHQSSLGRVVSVLDVGCGTGDLLTVWAARLGAEVLGIDTHHPSIQLARDRYMLPNLRFEVSTAEELLSSGEKYDIIICSEILEHLYEPESLLGVLRKMICSDGMMIVTIPNGWGPKENEERLVNVYRKCKMLITRKDAKNPPIVSNHPSQKQGAELLDTLNSECGHVQFYTMRAIRRLAQQSGFVVEKQVNRRFLSGPFSDILFGRNERFVEWNVRVARAIPYWLASSWMFVFRPVAGIID